MQFVIKTHGIEFKKLEKDLPSEEPVELNFWQKLLKLFGLYPTVGDKDKI